MYDIFNAKTGKHYLITDSEEFAKAIVNEHMFKCYHTDYAPTEWRKDIDKIGEGFHPAPSEENWQRDVEIIQNLIMAS